MAVVTHTLRGRHRGVMGSLDLNGVPQELWAEASPRPAIYSISANRWIKPGENTVRVTLAPGLAKDLPKPRFTLMLIMSSTTQMADETLAEFGPTRQPLTGPKTLEVKFRVEHPPPTRMWRDLQRIQPVEATRVEALAFAGQVIETLRSGTVEQAVELRRYVSDEWGAAKGFPPAKVRAAARHAAESFADRREWTVKPLDLARAKVSLIGDGDIVWVRSRSGGQAVVYRDRHGFELGFDLYLGKIGGRWTWVR